MGQEISGQEMMIEPESFLDLVERRTYRSQTPCRTQRRQGRARSVGGVASGKDDVRTRAWEAKFEKNTPQ